MPFENGHPKLGGRRKGVPNRATQEVRELARQILEDPDYQRSLRERVRAGDAPAMETMLWHYAYGRPPQGSEPESDTVQLKDVLEQLWQQHRGGEMSAGVGDTPTTTRRTPVRDQPS